MKWATRLPPTSTRCLARQQADAGIHRRCPRYKDLVKTFPDDVMNIVFVEYDLPGPSRMPWNARSQDKKRQHLDALLRRQTIRSVRLNPKTAKVDEFARAC